MIATGYCFVHELRWLWAMAYSAITNSTMVTWPKCSICLLSLLSNQY